MDLLGRKFWFTFMLVALACPIASSCLTSNYSFLKNMTVTPISVDGNIITVSVTSDVYFTQSAWKTFRYADGSFGPMSDWWQSLLQRLQLQINVYTFHLAESLR